MVLEPLLSFCPAFWTYRVTCIWFIQNCSVTSNFFNPKAIMKTCCLVCWTLMYCVILLWEIRCIKLIRKLGCVYRQQNYSACALMLYTKWTPCNGTDCPLGLQKRLKGICCPFSADGRIVAMVKIACKINCNLSDSDLYEVSSYILSTQLPDLTQSLSTSVRLSTIDGKCWYLLLLILLKFNMNKWKASLSLPSPQITCNWDFSTVFNSISGFEILTFATYCKMFIKIFLENEMPQFFLGLRWCIVYCLEILGFYALNRLV